MIFSKIHIYYEKKSKNELVMLLVDVIIHKIEVSEDDNIFA